MGTPQVRKSLEERGYAHIPVPSHGGRHLTGAGPSLSISAPPLATTPNGSLLRGALPFKHSSLDSGDWYNWKRTHFDKTVKKHLEGYESRLAAGKTDLTTAKRNSLRLSYWNTGSEEKLVCGDFDHVPPGFANFDHFFTYAEKTYPNALVMRSYSGTKVKMLFVVRVVGSQLTAVMALTLLAKLLEGTLFEATDKNHAALKYTYCNTRMLGELHRLSSLPVSLTHRIEPSSSPTRKKSQRLSTFWEFQGPLPEYLLKAVRGNRKKERYLRVILGTKAFTDVEGYGLADSAIARYLKTSQATVNRWKRDLESKRLLTLVDSRYWPGKLVRKYRASGSLRDFMAANERQRSTDVRVLKEPIEDGNWNTELWNRSRFFIDRPNQFIPYVKTLVGHDKNDRLKKAEGAIKNRLKWKHGINLSSKAHAR